MTTLSGIFSSGAAIVDTQTFIASGTWTKPVGILPTDLVVIDLWGGGGAGGCRGSNSDQTTGAGGGGGAHNRLQIRAANLNATETVTVGAGGTGVFNNGASTGGNGGYSEFKAHRAFGGGGGSNGYYNGGSGGGIYSAGISGIGSGINLRGGEPLVLAPTSTSIIASISGGNVFFRWCPGEWGGGGTSISYVEFDFQSSPIHGGAGAMTSSASFLRNSVWGGAAGGCYDGNGGSQNGGTSQFGGNGGAAVLAPFANSINGTDGSPRGGGGGGGRSNTSTVARGGNGGRGEVVITVYRGI